MIRLFRAPQTVYSPDILLNDFYLFAYINEKLKGMIFKA